MITRLLLSLAIGFCIAAAPASAEKASSAESEAQQAADAARDFMETGRYGQAIPLYEKLGKDYPKDSTIFYNLGTAWYLVGENKKAAESFERALKIKPDDAQALANLGLAYDALGRKKEAWKAYQDSLSVDPQSPSVRLKLAGFYESQGDAAQAEAEYQKMVAADPKFAEGRYWYGKSLAERGMFEEAWKEIHAAQDLYYPHIEPQFIERLRFQSPEPAYTPPRVIDAAEEKKIRSEWAASELEFRKSKDSEYTPVSK